MDKAFGVYFEETAIFAGHFNHVGQRVYFGYAEVGTVVENMDTFVRKISSCLVVPVKFIRKAAQKSSALARNLH